MEFKLDRPLPTGDYELGLVRRGDKFCVFAERDGSVLIDTLGGYDDPVDALILFQFIQSPVFMMEVSKWTPADYEAAKVKLRQVLMTSDQPKIMSIRVKLGLSEHPISDIRKMANP